MVSAGGRERGAAVVYRLDLDVSAPNVLLHDATGCVLVVQLGRLTVRDVPESAGEGGASDWGGGGVAALHLEHVGVELRLNGGGEVVKMLEDAELTARVELGVGVGGKGGVLEGKLEKMMVTLLSHLTHSVFEVVLQT